MTVDIEGTGDGGVRFDDRVQRRRATIYAGTPVEPVAASPAAFDHPVDAAATVTADELTLPQFRPAYVRDAGGEFVAAVEPGMRESFGPGTYTVDLSGPLKLFLRVEGPLTVAADERRSVVSLDAPREVIVGARTYHERPAATVTTTADPRDALAAFSALGSALKTTTHERSYPTLRGHPPAVELGEALSVPAGLDPPVTDAVVELPPTLRHAVVAAPLAYYLGVALVPGERPRVVGDDGFAHPLDGHRGFEGEVERVLKQTFLFDCVTRAESTAGLDLHEHRAVRERVDLDLDRVADADPTGRLAAALSVPYESVAEFVPEWKLTAHVDPRPEALEVVPFLVDDLAVIRTPTATPASGSDAKRESVDAFVRGGAGGESAPAGAGGRDAWTRGSETGAETAVVSLEPADSLEQAWVGEGAPAGASKALAAAYRNRLERGEADGDVDIAVVCNDSEMLEEHESVKDVYGSRSELPFDVTVHEALAAADLRRVLGSEVDFLHFIGHIDEEGLRCPDGWLDVRTLDSVGVDAFFLNACRSYRQGVALIETGAIGGVVTLEDVLNSGAVRVGETMARLLNRGFPLRAALTIASERSIVGTRYLVVGDGNLDIAHPESLVTNLGEVTTGPDGTFDLRVRTYPSGNVGLGTVWCPHVGDNETYFLVGSRKMQFTVDREALAAFLEKEVCPVLVDGRFAWSDQVSASDL